MIFLSLLFLVLALIVLVKGHLINNMFNNLTDFNKEHKDKFDKLTTEQQVGFLFKMFYIVGFTILHTILWILFLVNAISIDIYIYPTLIMIAIFTISILKTVIKSDRNRKSKDEYKVKKLPTRTVWRTVESIIEIVYFSYMIWILIF